MTNEPQRTIYITDRYIDSLSDQQIVEMTNLLDQREEELAKQVSLSSQEQPKVLKKVNKV